MPPVRTSLNFESLSDSELAQMLRDYGVDPGPVNEATRRAYERKLIRLKTGQASPPSQRYEPVDDDEDDDEEVILKPSVQSSAYRSQEFQSHRTVPDSDTPYRRIQSRPPLSTSQTTGDVPVSSTRRTGEKGKREAQSSSIPGWVKLAALAFIVVLVYLIYINMEPQVSSSIPSISNKMEV